jgi:leucyl/phenylalanyl-tRNA--protein transferase
MANCQANKRDGQNGTWITNDMIEAYCNLHDGIAKSVEVWHDGQIVGGLYGIDLGHVFLKVFSKFLMLQSRFYHLSAPFTR